MRVGELPLQHRPPSDRAAFERGAPFRGSCSLSQTMHWAFGVLMSPHDRTANAPVIHLNKLCKPCLRSGKGRARLSALAGLCRQVKRLVRLAAIGAHSHGTSGPTSVTWLHARLIQCMPALQGAPCLQRWSGRRAGGWGASLPACMLHAQCSRRAMPGPARQSPSHSCVRPWTSTISTLTLVRRGVGGSQQTAPAAHGIPCPGRGMCRRPA